MVLQVFAAMARTGCTLGRDAEERLSQGLPLLSAHLEEGPALWHHLQGILTGVHAGDALRSMHALGVLELLIPEFHGIDALVIRDAYHRYTVDEHTFVLIDTLHGLESAQKGAMAEWAARFGGVLRELPHPELLYLAALLHDTGKGRSTGDHARESARMAQSVLERLELDAYESGLVLSLITEPSGDVGCAAAGHLRCGDGAGVCGEGADAGGAADADAVYVCGYQCGASGCADAVEGGESVAAVYRDGELSGSQRG